MKKLKLYIETKTGTLAKLLIALYLLRKVSMLRF